MRGPGFRGIFDATCPSSAVMRDLVDDLERRTGCVYIHCAQGHGRTGLVAAALLLKRGLARSPDDAMSRVQSVRPGVRLNRDQRRCLSDVAGLLTSTTRPAGS